MQSAVFLARDEIAHQHGCYGASGSQYYVNRDRDVVAESLVVEYVDEDKEGSVRGPGCHGDSSRGERDGELAFEGDHGDFAAVYDLGRKG